jgi:hypothetical protein
MLKRVWSGQGLKFWGGEGSQRKNPRYEIGIALNAIVIPYSNLLDYLIRLPYLRARKL